MRAKSALLVAVALVFGAIGACAGAAKRAKLHGDAEADSPVADAAAGGAGGAAHEDERPEPPRPDPALVEEAVDRTGASEPAPDALGLRFEVVENGPDSPWAFAVVNRGSEPLLVALDPRLLSLELETPLSEEEAKKKWKSKPKPRSCRLPATLRPAEVSRRTVRLLEPGEGHVEAFDPLLYCLPERGRSPFLPGVKVSARFGFEPKTKVVWRRGQRVEELLPQTEPFVARPLPKRAVNDPGEVDAGDGDADGGEELLERGADARPGVKELAATPFELGSDYTPSREPEGAVLSLELDRGSDAGDESDATITLSVANRSPKPVYVYFRRELVSFQVTGPDGVVTCDPQPDERSPDRQAFALLNPGRSVSATSRLIELCPDDTFARPGLYVIRAVLDASERGAEYGLNAFTGRVVAPRPVVVRIRRGELPFLGRRVMQKVRVGEARAVPDEE